MRISLLTGMAWRGGRSYFLFTLFSDFSFHEHCSVMEIPNAKMERLVPANGLHYADMNMASLYLSSYVGYHVMIAIAEGIRYIWQ